MAAAWVSRVSMSLPLIMVSIAPSRYTLRLEYGEFAVNIVGRRLEKAAYGVFGSRTGRGIDKLSESGVKARRGKKTRAPILEDAPVSVRVQACEDCGGGGPCSSSARIFLPEALRKGVCDNRFEHFFLQRGLL